MPKKEEPRPISLEDAQRIWSLQKQNLPLSKRDIALLDQAAEWQMWASHGIRLQSGKTDAVPSLPRSKGSRRTTTVC